MSRKDLNNVSTIQKLYDLDRNMIQVLKGLITSVEKKKITESDCFNKMRHRLIAHEISIKEITKPKEEDNGKTKTD